jgi:hypothetical protein
MVTTNKPDNFRSELEILYGALCSGLLQEVRRRSLANLISGQYDFTLTNERGEQGIVPLLGAHLQSIGFIVKYESYFNKTSPNLRPDSRVWLPASHKFIFLEVKMTGWGDSGEEYYWTDSIDDMNKLNALTGDDSFNGFLSIGFSKPKESLNQLENGFNKLSSDVTTKFRSYEKIGIERINLLEMDRHTPYAVIGLWFRKQ